MAAASLSTPKPVDPYFESFFMDLQEQVQRAQACEERRKGLSPGAISSRPINADMLNEIFFSVFIAHRQAPPAASASSGSAPRKWTISPRDIPREEDQFIIVRERIRQINATAIDLAKEGLVLSRYRKLPITSSNLASRLLSEVSTLFPEKKLAESEFRQRTFKAPTQEELDREFVEELARQSAREEIEKWEAEAEALKTADFDHPDIQAVIKLVADQLCQELIHELAAELAGVLLPKASSGDCSEARAGSIAAASTLTSSAGRGAGSSSTLDSLTTLLEKDE